LNSCAAGRLVKNDRSALAREIEPAVAFEEDLNMTRDRSKRPTQAEEEVEYDRWIAILRGNKQFREIFEDEQAGERLITLFRGYHKRDPFEDSEAFEWAAAMDDASLVAIGFKDRESFNYVRDIVLMIDNTPRVGEKVH
jgi:hypothetical protein